MNREQFLEETKRLKAEDKSIRAIAAELDVPKGRVERALRTLTQRPSEDSVLILDQLRSTTSRGSSFIGRHREMGQLRACM